MGPIDKTITSGVKFLIAIQGNMNGFVFQATGMRARDGL